VAPVQAAAGTVAVQPHPSAAGAKPFAQLVGPTASHAPLVSDGIVPAPQLAGALTGSEGTGALSSAADEHPARASNPQNPAAIQRTAAL
jgi:hypothetical protein